MRLGISGACGRMGKRIAFLATLDKEITIAATIEREDSGDISKPFAGIIGVSGDLPAVSADIRSACDEVDCFIDFTSPQATMEHLDIYRDKGIPVVIGATGIAKEDEELIGKAAESIPIVYAPNMSVGVNVFFKLIADATKTVGLNADIKIEETHHIHKKDAPSGTAKMMGKIVADIKKEEPEILSHREGEVVGDHRIVFNNEFETLEIRHAAKTRDIFASGAIKAAKYLTGKGPGLYSMADVLGL